MADLHDLLDGPDEELDFEPDEEATMAAAPEQRQKAPQAGKPARDSPQHPQTVKDRSARAKDPISWSASMDGGSSGGAGSKQQSGSERALQRGADPSGKGDVPPKQPKNSVIGFLRQRLSATETPTAEPARKPALKSQLADKSKAVPANELQQAASERLDNAALSRTAKRRDERKRARGRDSSGHDDMQEPVRKRQVSPGARHAQGGHSHARSRSRSDPLERLRGPFADEVVPLDAPAYGAGRHQSRPLGPEFRHPDGPEPWLPWPEVGRRGRDPPPPPPPMHGARFERGWMLPPRGGPAFWDGPPQPFDDRHFDRPPRFDGPPPPPFFGEPPFDERPPFDRPHFDRPPFDRPPFERPPPPFRGDRGDRPPLGPPGRSRSPPPPPRRLSPPLRRRSPSPPPPPEVLPPPPPGPGGKPKRSLDEENDRRGYGRQGGYSPPRKRGNAPPSPQHLGLRPQHSGRPSSVARPHEAVPERRRAPSPEARRGSSPARHGASSAAAARPEPVPDRKPDPERASGSRQQRQDPPDDHAAVRSPPRRAAASDDRLGGSGRRAEPSSAGDAAASQTAAPREAKRTSGTSRNATPAQQPAPAKPKAAAQAPASANSSAQRPGTEQPSSGPSANGSTGGGKAAVKPTGAAAQPATNPARSSEQSSRFTFNTPASEEKLWFYRDTKGVVQGPHSVKEYRSWLQGLERLSTLKPEMARELDEFSSMLLWREGSSKRVPILKVVG